MHTFIFIINNVSYFDCYLRWKLSGYTTKTILLLSLCVVSYMHCDFLCLFIPILSLPNNSAVESRALDEQYISWTYAITGHC